MRCAFSQVVRNFLSTGGVYHKSHMWRMRSFRVFVVQRAVVTAPLPNGFGGNGVELPPPGRQGCLLYKDNRRWQGGGPMLSPARAHWVPFKFIQIATHALLILHPAPPRIHEVSRVSGACCVFMVNVGAGPSSQGTNSVIVSCGFPEPVGISLLCCAHVGPPPLFEQSPDRRMGWSKFVNRDRPIGNTNGADCRSGGASPVTLIQMWDCSPYGVGLQNESEVDVVLAMPFSWTIPQRVALFCFWRLLDQDGTSLLLERWAHDRAGPGNSVVKAVSHHVFGVGSCGTRSWGLHVFDRTTTSISGMVNSCIGCQVQVTLCLLRRLICSRLTHSPPMRRLCSPVLVGLVTNICQEQSKKWPFHHASLQVRVRGWRNSVMSDLSSPVAAPRVQIAGDSIAVNFPIPRPLANN